MAQSDLVVVQLGGERAGAPLSTHGARQMIERSGRRAGLGRIRPHAFRHSWATALTEASGDAAAKATAVNKPSRRWAGPVGPSLGRA